jgi:acetyl esterase/lipase
MVMQLRRYWRFAVVAFPLMMTLGCAWQPSPAKKAASVEHLMTPGDLEALPRREPDQRIAYGTESSQYGELRIPAGTGPHPLVILIHGGCFKASYGTAHYLGAMADVLKSEGIATWNVEYRRLGEPGSGWPGTYLDIGRAVDHVRVLAGKYHLDLGRVVVVGHSAGGHLAMWTAARRHLPKASALFVAEPLPVRGVVDLAGPVDMTANIPGYGGSMRRHSHYLAARGHAGSGARSPTRTHPPSSCCPWASPKCWC